MDNQLRTIETTVDDLPVDLSVTDAALADMRERLAGIDAGDDYDGCRNAIAECRTTRVSVEKRRKELKADALAWGRKVDGEAKRITAEIEDIEGPLKESKQAIDDAKLREKEAKEREEREAAEAKAKAEREAEEARLKAIREADEERLRLQREKEEKRIAAERAELEKAQAKAEAKAKEQMEALRAERAEAEAKAEEERKKLAEERAAVEAERQKIESEKRAEAERKAEEERIELERVQAEQRARELESLRPDIDKAKKYVEEVWQAIDSSDQAEVSDKRIKNILSEFEGNLDKACADAMLQLDICCDIPQSPETLDNVI